MYKLFDSLVLIATLHLYVVAHCDKRLHDPAFDIAHEKYTA